MKCFAGRKIHSSTLLGPGGINVVFNAEFRRGEEHIWCGTFLRQENQDEWIRRRRKKSITVVRSNISQGIVSFHQQILRKMAETYSQLDVWLKRLKKTRGLRLRSEWSSNDLSDYRRSGKRVSHSGWTARNEKLSILCQGEVIWLRRRQHSRGEISEPPAAAP